MGMPDGTVATNDGQLSEAASSLESAGDDVSVALKNLKASRLPDSCMGSAASACNAFVDEAILAMESLATAASGLSTGVVNAGEDLHGADDLRAQASQGLGY